VTATVPAFAWRWVIFLVVAVALPAVFSSRYATTLLVTLAFGVYLGLSWNLLAGLVGEHSLGHGAFVGIGAYTSTLLLVHLAIPPWLGMLGGGILSAVLAVGIGYVTFRSGVTGPYFLMLTVAVSQILLAVTEALDVVGGPRGLTVPFRGDAPWLMQFREPRAYYYLILGLIVVVLVTTEALKRGRSGFAYTALRLDERAAEASGIDVLRYKLLAFGLSGFLAALGGTFYAQYYQYLSAPTLFGLSLSILAMVYPIVGGIHATFGPVVGGIVLFPAAELLKRHAGDIPGLDVLLYGTVLVSVMLLAPGGLAGVAGGFRRARLAAPPSAPAVTETPRRHITP
jgi:branched-chain amino acid transport system permease protein